MDNESGGLGPSELQKQLGKIIEHGRIKTVFQPIVSLRDGSVLGYEALSRGPDGTPLKNPDALFGVAVECGKLWELEQLCRTKALESAFKNGADLRLFLNVNPSVIHDEKFKRGFTKEYLNSYGINPENIFFEITEKSAVSDLEGFKKTIDHYKRQNYRIAIDDAGAGYSGLNMITDIHPHYIKLDINLIRDIDKDAYKRALVKSLQEFSRLADIALIAEGVETEEELSTLIDIGVHYAQGYFIQRPQEQIIPIEEEVLADIRSENSKRNHVYHHNLSSIYIGNLSMPNPTVSPDQTAEDVYDLFLKKELIPGVAVVKDGIVVGSMTRTSIDHLMSGQFGYSLHAKRPIRLIMEAKPLQVEFTTPVDVVSKQAMSRSAPHLYDFIIVIKDGKYYGIVTIKELLDKTMEIEVSNARHQNPLSGLPGNLIIERSLNKCVTSSEPFTVLYIDLDNFKAFNDVYGFENGDKVIRFVADMLGDIFPEGSFIGHVGGDDFVAIIYSYEYEDLCNELISEFDVGIKDFYTEDDLEKGYITAKDRKGEEEQYPIMSVSVSGVTNRYRAFGNIYQLTECASGIKKKCKRIWKSCFCIE